MPRMIPKNIDPDNRDSGYFFSTVQAFKGLESPVVIYTDVSNVFMDAMKNLFYVGITRARSALYVIASEKAAKALNAGGVI